MSQFAQKGLSRYFGSLLLALCLACLCLSLQGQTVTATLTGTVSDASGAVVPNAPVTITNENSGDVRRTVSNSTGYFSVSALQPGSYTVSIEAPGFNKWEQKGISLNPGDKRNVSEIALAVSGAAESVTVEATAVIAPVDSGEKSDVITTKQIQNVSVVGRNAAEMIKILPGMALTGSITNRPGFTGESEGTGSGPIGSFSANGQRTGALDITSDGAHVIDPGCNCGQAVNTNADMTQEMKILTSNFGAENQKGPVVIEAVGKSGGSAFHGEAYLYARNYTLNANDWLNNSTGNGADGKALTPRPQTQYYYPGGNIGGPVLIPGTNFNKNRDKLFFFIGFEYYKQDVDNGVYRSFVPTQDMRNGIFSSASLNSYIGSSSPGYAITGQPSLKDANGNQLIPGGIIPSNLIDPNGKILMNLYPLPNADPKTNRGSNFVLNTTKPQDLYQLRPRVDWSISDNTKLFVSYNRQRDNGQFTDTLWWRPDPTVPYPGGIVSHNESDSWSANLTHVFNPSLTNEAVFTYTVLNLPNSISNPSRVNPKTLGLNYKTIFGADPNVIPSMTGWSDGIANMIQPSGYQLTGSLYAKKNLPTFADNLSKVWGTHSMKFGAYWESTANDQPSSNNSNGELTFSNWGSNTTGNAYADMLMGRITQYSESNGDTILKMHYTSADFYAQDSWKVSRRLTLEYGMRFDHLGPWVDNSGYGFAVFDPAKYAAGVGGVPQLPGVEWHKVDSALPASGSKGRLFFYDPRLGFAWDIFGSGRTVFRGGWGMYRFHDEQNVQAGAMNIPRLLYTYTAPNSLTFADIGNLSANFTTPGGINVVNYTDTQQPRTQSYSATISERLPWASLFEISYVGNKSDYLSNWNNNFGQLNDIQFGTLFNTPNAFFPGGSFNANPDATSYRKYNKYGTIKEVNHKMYSNYNALQASWNKQSGRLNFMLNYTFSKALGIRGEGGSPTGDPLNLSNNYGTLPNDRTHIFNASYILQLPDPIKGNPILKGVVNGWQLSGITQLQSGPNLQAVYSSNFGIGGGYVPAGTVLPGGAVVPVNPNNASGWGMSSSLITGSPDISIQPILTCNPASGLGNHQFINGACFALPSAGHNGSFIFPYIHGPAYFNSDLSMFKNFQISESKKLQFRVSAYNFLNHPLSSFIPNDPNLNLSFDASGKLTNTRFGYADSKVGHRIIQLAAKFYF